MALSVASSLKVPFVAKIQVRLSVLVSILYWPMLPLRGLPTATSCRGR